MYNEYYFHKIQQFFTKTMTISILSNNKIAMRLQRKTTIFADLLIFFSYIRNWEKINTGIRNVRIVIILF